MPCSEQPQHFYYPTKKEPACRCPDTCRWSKKPVALLGTAHIHLASLLLKVCWLLRWWCAVHAQQLESFLGRVFAGIVDVLAVVPEAGLDVLTVYCNHAAPGRTTTCDNELVSEAHALLRRRRDLTSAVRNDLEVGCTNTLAAAEICNGISMFVDDVLVGGIRTYQPLLVR